MGLKGNLFAQFSVVSFVHLAIIAVILVVVISTTTRSSAIDSLVDEAVAAYSDILLSEISPADLEVPMTGERYETFHKFVQESVVSHRTARIKLWAKDGTIIYSDNPETVGEKFPDHEHFLSAISGEITAKIEEPEELESEGESFSDTMLEVYVPIIFPGIAEPQGVFEIYQYYEHTGQLIADLSRVTYLTVGIGFAVLYGTLVSSVWRGWRTIVRNREERQKVEEAIRESEQKYSTLVEKATDGVAVVQDEIYIFANTAFEKITGYKMKELSVMNFIDIVAPESKKLVQERYRARIAGKVVPDVYEVKLKRKDGTTIDIELSATAIDYQGRPANMAIAHDITERKQAEEERRRTTERLQKTTKATIDALAMAVGQRDPYTASHQLRVAQLVQAIAREIGMSEDRVEGIRLAGIIHDIGKINVPAEILSKSGRLSEAEYSLIKTHPQAGYDILKNVEFSWPLAEAILQHHERIDGSGYPNGLKGKDISLEAKILAVSEVVEAMSSHRPYRPALGISNALNEIENKKDILYDKDIVDICMRLFTKKDFKFE